MDRDQRNIGICMSDGYTIGGIPRTIPDQQIVPRHGTRQLIPESSQDFSPNNTRILPKDHSYQDTRPLSNQTFVYAPTLIQNFSPQYQSNSCSGYHENRMQDMRQPEANRHDMDDGRYYGDNRLSAYHRGYASSNADIHDNYTRHHPHPRADGYAPRPREEYYSSRPRENHYTDMGYMRHPRTQNYPSYTREQEYRDMYYNGMSYPRSDGYHYPDTDRYPVEPRSDRAVGYYDSRTPNITQDRSGPQLPQMMVTVTTTDSGHSCGNLASSRQNPPFEGNDRYPSYRTIDNSEVVTHGGFVNRRRTPPRPHTSHTSNENHTLEEELQPAADPGIPEEDLPDKNVDTAPEGEPDPEHQPVDIPDDTPAVDPEPHDVPDDMPAVDPEPHDQPEGDTSEPVEEIPEPEGVTHEDEVTDGTPEGDVYPPTVDVDQKEPQAPKKSIFKRLFAKRGGKNKIIEKDDPQPLSGETNKKPGKTIEGTTERDPPESDLTTKRQAKSPALRDNKSKAKNEPEKPAVVQRSIPEDTGKSQKADEKVEKKKKSVKTKLNDAKAGIKKKAAEAKAKVQKAAADAKDALKKAFKPKIKNPFKKKKK